jgi:hypothetical protein
VELHLHSHIRSHGLLLDQLRTAMNIIRSKNDEVIDRSRISDMSAF